ncbi:MAG: T9SS type A sorting domain-containing protein [Saprospiraceae bacterium]
MKNFFFFMPFFILSTSNAQLAFVVNGFQGPNVESIYDVVYNNDKYYCLGLDLEPTSPFRSWSQLYIFDNSGTLLDKKTIGEEGTRYYQFISIINDTLTLLGNLKSENCSSKLILDKYILSENTRIPISEFEFCNDQFIQMARLINGYEYDKFVEGYYNSNSVFYKFVMRLDSKDQFSKIFDSLSVYNNFSVDFSRKGYILKQVSLCKFYDRDFIFRKQLSNFEDGVQPSPHSTVVSFGKNEIIEHAFKRTSDSVSGQIIRMVDSSLQVKKIAFISPPGENKGNMDLPFFGGLDIDTEKNIWAAGTYGFSPFIDSNYFSITKLDSNLNIICNHFIGYDAIYRLFGITSLGENGAIIYGWRLPKGFSINGGGEDIYAIKVGENCELPFSVSTTGPQQPLLSISAYPNPGLNDLTFSVNGFDPSTLRVELIDESGHLLFSQKDLTNSIRVPELSAGQYFYRILKGEKLMGIGSWVKQ